MEKLKIFQIKIFTLIFVGYACYAYTRKCVVYVFPVLTSLGLSTNHLGSLVSCQNGAYAVSKFAGGIISDKASPRLMFSFGLFLSGMSVILFSASSSMHAYFLLMIINGLTQGCGWPAGVKLLQQWFCPTQFGTMWSILASSGNVSFGVTPFLSAYICLYYGWKASLQFAGLAAVLMSATSLIFIIDRPEDVKLKSFVNKEATKPLDDRNGRKWYLSLKVLLKDRVILMVSFYSMVSLCIKTCYVEWGPLYLTEQLGFTQYAASSFRSSIEFGAFFGGLFTGFVTDFIHKNKKFGGNPRMYVGVVYIFIQSILLHIFRTYINNSTSQICLTSLGLVLGACVYSPIDIFGVIAAESVPHDLSGASQAIVALAANIGGITSGLPITMIANSYDWTAVFTMLEYLSIGTLIFMLVTTNAKREPQKRE